MLNFTLSPDILRPFVPQGVKLDTFEDRHYVSIVGFQMLGTRVRGLSIPYHVNFEELNLRFYVKREVDGVVRRGVTFIKEIVPRRAIAWAARRFYNENYVCMPMRHDHRFDGANPQSLRYGWQHAGQWEHLAVNTAGESYLPDENSEETFITEHYWGYAAQADGSTLEYQVEHPRWQVWQATDVDYDSDVGKLYGEGFAEALRQPPTSAFVADGSEVKVRVGMPAG
jgi:uncharacterized protein YqjF (DUF2071 family)